MSRVHAVVEQAARNNAHACELMCRAHGAAGEFVGDALWWHRAASPPFQPNLVTLRADAAPLALERIAALPAGWSVNDSHAALELASLGASVRFDATWFSLDPMRQISGASDPALRWSLVETRAELAAWEQVWRLQHRLPDGAPPQFPASLLGRDDVRFIAAHRRREPVVGAMLNLGAEAVGLSNVVAMDRAIPWPSLIRFARVLHALQPLVGHAHGEALRGLVEVGVEPLGPLRVWTARAAGTP